MARGIIYIMTTAVPGLIKIGKTGSNNFESRMYSLEHNGYRNVTALKREFAIEVDGYDEKEQMLHTIFEKSNLAGTELFALDKNIAKQLLSSFDGTVVYPKTETKEEIFTEASENEKSRLIPDGIYTFKRKKKSDNKVVTATAEINDGRWTLKKGSILGVTEGIGGAQKAKELRATLPMESNGYLLEDVDLGLCSPSFAANVVMNMAINGWAEWYNSDGKAIDMYRKKETE